MARYLYRLGRFAARRAWAVVLVWVLVLAAAGGAAASLGTSFTSRMTIPGTEFQNVIDDLTKSLPAASGGTATVVFTTANGQPFTQAQKDAIAATVKDWSAIPGVKDAQDPFVTQADLDDASTKVVDGAAKLKEAEQTIADNAAKLADGRKKAVDGKATLETNAAKLVTGRRQLEAGAATLAAAERTIATNEAKLVAGEKKLVAGEAQLASGKKQLAAGEAQIVSGQKQIDAGAAQIAAGRQQLNAAKSQVADGEAQVAAGRSQLAAQQQQIDALAAQADSLSQQVGEGDPQVVALRAQVSQGQQQIDAGTAQLNAQAAQLTATKQTLATQEATLNASASTLAAKQAQLTAGAKTLAAKKAQLLAGERTLKASRAQLESGKAQLAAGKRKLAAGKATLAASRAKLDAGDAAIAQGRLDLEAAAQQILDGQKKLDDAKVTIADKKAELARGQRQVALISGLRTVNTSGTTAVTTVGFEKSMQETTQATKDSLPAATSDLTAAGVTVYYSKDIAESMSFAGPGEAIGVLIAGVVLLVMLGSLLAAGLPLLTALVGVAAGLLAVVAATHWYSMSNVTPMLALMLGLAVGIDYALFIVHRHRQQIARGIAIEESIGIATGTAGSAVLFAGLTVVVALAALTVVNIPFLATMGLSAALTVAIAIVVSLTLTPALLSLMGNRVLSPRSRRTLLAKLASEENEADTEDLEEKAAAAEGQHRPSSGQTHGHGWGAIVTRHPVLTLVATTVLLGALAIPAASLRLGLPDSSAEPHDSTAYKSYATISQEFGAGQNATMLAVAKIDPAVAKGLTDDQATDLQISIAERMKQTTGVEYVVPAKISDDKATMIFQIVPTTGPSEEATEQLVHDLRTDRASIIDTTAVDSIGFAGQTVANIDISERLAAALPVYLALVVGISLVLLLLVFRSIVVPLLATGGFLLSIAASFGTVVAIYQWGWLGALFAVESPAPILSFLPTLAIGILFGLAMDYQMFLVSGMREAWSHGHTARTAVRTGFSHGARVVTAAALIMTSVFASFIFSHMTMVRPIGFALAAGVLIDAFLVRMTAMPAMMHLLGEKAWYLPAWLDRILPDLDVEGTSLEGAGLHSAPPVTPAAEPARA